MTYAISSDRSFINVGARNDGDSVGNLVSTAVLIRTPANRDGDPDWAYRPTRVDLLMYARPQPTRSITDFFLTLFSDDGSEAHNPAVQLTTPFALSAQTFPLQQTRAIWYQQEIVSAGWPIMPQQTYYWVVVTPGSPLTMPNGLYNGALWSGMNASATRAEGGAILPPFILGDTNLFTGRELLSERFTNDAAFGSNTAAAVSFLRGSSNWPNYGAPRFTNFVVSPPFAGVPPVRYGVQVLGWQVTPSSSLTSSRKRGH